MLSDDQSLQIFAEIVEKLEATARANQSTSKSLAEMKAAMVKLNENQVALQQSSEAILLAAHEAEDRAKRAEESWLKAEKKIDDFAREICLNNQNFVESAAQFKQLKTEWDSFSKGLEYRIRSIEEASLPALHETVGLAVAEVDRQVQSLKLEFEQKYLTIEQYRDDQQNEAIATRQQKIEEYEGIFEQVKAFIKRGGGWVWGVLGASVILVKDQVPWDEVWGWFVDNFFN